MHPLLRHYCFTYCSYGTFDDVAEEHGVYKVMAIANMWLGVAGALDDGVDHAQRIATTALQIMQTMAREATKWKLAGEYVHIQIGINTGEVAAGVIGTRTPK